MAKKNFDWRINASYLESVENGSKVLAINAIYPGTSIPQEGDTITFHSSFKKSSKFEVKRVALYSSFGKMLTKENYKCILPDATSAAEALYFYKHIFSGKKNYGIIVCQIASA